jgi:hypothetical protein
MCCSPQSALGQSFGSHGRHVHVILTQHMLYVLYAVTHVPCLLVGFALGLALIMHAFVCSCRSFQVSCSPLSPFERRLAATPSGLTATEGWFKVCVSGGANSPQLAAAAAAAATGAVTSSALALVPASSEPGTPSAAAGAAAIGCSEYCAKLAEAMYTLCDHALTLLVATAPAVDPAEVASGQGLGPMWPSVRALAAVLVSLDATQLQQGRHLESASLMCMALLQL